MATDRDRQHLFVALEATLGEGPASTLMHLLPPQGWDDVARQAELVVMRAELKGEMAELRGEMAELRGEMRAFRGEVTGELAELRGRIDGQIPKFLAANIPLVFGTAGLVFAAARLA